MAVTQERRRGGLGVSRNVIFLGFSSLLTDISTEMILNVLPLFLANVLGVGTAIIGVIEGVADTTATLTRAPSGWLSDRLHRRKTLALLGYGLSTVSKPLFALASSWALVLGLRFSDRVGKGIRGAPRDALIADSSNDDNRGRSFGLHRSLDTAGAMIGILGAALVVFLMQRGSLDLRADTFRVIALIATVPAALGVIVLWRFVEERRQLEQLVGATDEARANREHFPTRFKLLLAVVLLFALANSSDAFLILRAQNLGMSVPIILLLLAAFNLVYAGLATPAGILSDRIGRGRLMIGGWVVYVLVYLGFALAGASWQVSLLFLGYGIYYAAAEGVGRALVADLAPATRRGAAYGLYNTAVGITAFPASVIAGVLWQAYGPQATFVFGAALAGLAVILLALVLRSGAKSQIVAPV